MPLLDEPAADIDVGAKAQLHKLVADLAKQGAAILLASSDVPELLSLCDRILLMNAGAVAADLPASEASEEQVIRLASLHGGLGSTAVAFGISAWESIGLGILIRSRSGAAGPHRDGSARRSQVHSA